MSWFRFIFTAIIILGVYALGYLNGSVERNFPQYAVVHKTAGEPCPAHYSELHGVLRLRGQDIPTCVFIPPTTLDKLYPGEEILVDDFRFTPSQAGDHKK